MYHIIYKITHTNSGKYYIGAHSTNDVDDGYMGSGKRIRNAIKKYGINAFTKEILFFAFTEQYLYLIEQELVSLTPDSFNIVPGGMGGDKVSFLSDEKKKEHAIKTGIASRKHWENMSQEEFSRRQETARQIAKNRDNTYLIERNKTNRHFGEQNHFFGKKHSSETKEKMRLAKLGKKRVSNGN